MSTTQEVSTKPKRSRRSRAAKEVSGDAPTVDAPVPSKSTDGVPTEEQGVQDGGERKKRHRKRKQSDAAKVADGRQTVEKEAVKETAPKVVEEVEAADGEKKKRKRRKDKNAGADAVVSEPVQEPTMKEPEAAAKDGEGTVAEGAAKKRKRSRKSDAAVGEQPVSQPAVITVVEDTAEHEDGPPTVEEKGKRRRRKSTKGEEATKEPSISTQPPTATQAPTATQSPMATQTPVTTHEQTDAPSKKSKKAERKSQVSDDKKTVAPSKSDDPPQKAPTKEPKKAAPVIPSLAKIVDAPKDDPFKDAAPGKKAVKASKKAAKPPSPEPEPKPSHSEADPADVAAAEDSDDEDVHLHGFSTDEDSSDEEMDGGEAPAIDVGMLPTIAKDDATVKRKLEKAKRQATEDRGVVYLGRIPHGFYEDQMKAYFSQFGNVTRLRLSRNKKTGRSKHYGFLEFDSSSVAQIVAETMDNYLLTGHILKCKVIPKDEVHPELWVGANRKWRPVPQGRIARVKHHKPRTEEEQEAAEKRLMQRQAARKRKLADAGIKYDFDDVAYKKKPKTVVS